MKVKKIFDTDNIQGFKISNPSKNFKKMFPKKYILSFDMMGRHEVMNINTLPNTLSFLTPIGYIFTYENSLPKILESKRVAYEDLGSTFARCLDTYFIGDEKNEAEKIDIVLACGTKNKVVPPTLTEEIMIRCNSVSLMSKCGGSGGGSGGTKSESNESNESNESKLTTKDKIDNIRKNVVKIVNSYIKDRKMNVEEWVKNVIFNYPINNNGLPVRYPSNINDSNINSFKIDVKDIFVEYDFRAKSYEHENEFISLLEDAFESSDSEIQISNTYNNILDTIKKKLDEKKYSWKEIDENTIKTKLKYLRDIDVEYQLTDFI